MGLSVVSAQLPHGSLEVMSATRVCAAFLTKLRQIAEASLQRPVAEVVIACPSWFRQANRAALLAAAEIAGLKCLRLVSEMAASERRATGRAASSLHSPLVRRDRRFDARRATNDPVFAAALDFGLYRRQHFANSQPQVVAFVDLGHSASSVCVARFSSEGCEILSEGSDPELGGRDLDRLIMAHFAEVFKKAHGFNPLEGVKARLKSGDDNRPRLLSAGRVGTSAVRPLLVDVQNGRDCRKSEEDFVCQHGNHLCRGVSGGRH